MMMDGFTSESRTRDGFQPRRPPDEDCDSDDISSSELDILERVEQDLRQLEINGPVIAELDSLEKFVPDKGNDDSDDSFFNYDQLEEKSPSIRILSRNGCVDDLSIPDHVEEEATCDLDGDIVPGLDWTEDETDIANAPASPCRRAERFRDKVAACKMVRVKKSVQKIENSRASGIDVHATMWARWRRLMSDHMCVEWTRAMGRIDRSVAKVFEDESERRLPSQEEIDTYMIVVPMCNDNDVLEDEPLTKRFKDDESLDRAVDAVARRPRRAASRVVGGRRVRLAKGITVDSGGGRQCYATSPAPRQIQGRTI